MVIAKKYTIKKHFEGSPDPKCLELVEEELPALKSGEYLLEAEFLSVDPYQRAYNRHYPLGSTMYGFQVAKIIESKNPNYPVGKRVHGHFGWRTQTIVDPNNSTDSSPLKFAPYLLPDVGDLPVSLGLGVLGMPGNTAYFGFVEICQPKAGETLVVSGAGGAVGSQVGQIGKILGMKVIGIAGSDEKCQWITKELGFDHAINYKTDNIKAKLQEFAPDRVDCYFDNVGGEISSIVAYQMNIRGRISVCGSISAYNNDPENLQKCTVLQPAIVALQLKIEGFVVVRWLERWMEGIQQNLQWIREGKLKYRETVTQGFDNMFHAFDSMLKGGNFGKAVVKI